MILGACITGNHFPGISCRIGFMDDNSCFGALASSFFVFVGPAAIVGHSISGEQAGILRSKAGIVNQHNNGFSFYVQVFIIIPAVLRSYDAVSYKYELTV